MSVARGEERILITGGGGFVGRWLVRELHSRLQGQSRIIVASHATGMVPEGTHPLVFDIADPSSVDAAVAAARPTGIVHLAAISNVDEARQDLRRTWNVNLGGTLNVAMATLKCAPTARFIYVSTAEVYGGQFNRSPCALDENAKLEPTNAYAASKAAADLMIGQMARLGLNAVRFRPFNHTGAGQADTFAVPAFAAQIARIEAGLARPVIKVGNLEAKRDFVDVRDIVRAYADALLKPCDWGQGIVMNLASGLPRRIGDILDHLLSMASVPVTIEQDPDRMRPNDTPVAWGDARLAAAELGWVPRHEWPQTLADVLADWRQRTRA